MAPKKVSKKKEASKSLLSKKKERSKRLRLVQGEVVSDKMDKTRVVLINTKKRHPLLKHSLLRSRRIKIHDERNESKLGDRVIALETRSLSRDKRHCLFKILGKIK